MPLTLAIQETSAFTTESARYNYLPYVFVSKLVDEKRDGLSSSDEPHETARSVLS